MPKATKTRLFVFLNLLCYNVKAREWRIMKSSKIIHKITQGMYILTVGNGGCVVDAVMRAGSQGDQPLVAVSIAKANHSNELLSQNDRFALSVLGQDVDPNLIQTFGFRSARDINKYTDIKMTEVEGVKVIDDTLGYMVFEKIDAIENDSHVIYIGKLIAEKLEQPDAEPMSYDYYREHKDALTEAKTESKDDLTKVKTEQNKTAWVCTVCGYVYYGDEVPDDYICPLCGLGKSYFKKKD